MNAIIGLCHFCELHGPSILFCTQAFHSHDPCLLLSSSLSSCDESQSYSRGLQRSLSTGTGQQAGEPVGGDITASAPSLPQAAKSTQSCEACKSFQNGHPGFISNDHEAKVSYISCQQPNHPQVYTMLRQACVRSLSCEVCPGREGPIFFGDDHRGHVLSHTFFMKDTHARGLQRWYSIVVVMMDKIYLLNSWPFLVKHLRSVIDDLQEKATRVYDHEQKHCPQSANKLKQRHVMTPANFRQHRSASKQTRSLFELTADKKIFKKLHLAFTWILKSGGNRLTEKLLEGPPTEDSIIDMEKQEETEEGFVMLYSRKVSSENENETKNTNALNEEEEEDIGPQFISLRHMFKTIGWQHFHSLVHHVVIGNQLVVRAQSKATIKSVIDVLQTLLPKGCSRMIYYSDKYEDSWRCNFLGLAPGTPLPHHATLYITMDIIAPEVTSKEDNSPPRSLRCTNVDENDFVGYNFMLNSPVVLPEKCPSVLEKMEYALRNESLADSVVEQCLICLKEEWMNKVKVLFKFTKAGGNRSEDDTKKLYQVVGAQNEDRPVLKFWMTGLSVQYRNHMLTTVKPNRTASTS